ncbi:hypothetical protein [Alloalcanivorax xenomutans]
MERRVENLEKVTADINVTLARLDERMGSTATKSDVANLKVWFVLTAIALSGSSFAVARFIA